MGPVWSYCFSNLKMTFQSCRMSTTDLLGLF